MSKKKKKSWEALHSKYFYSEVNKALWGIPVEEFLQDPTETKMTSKLNGLFVYCLIWISYFINT